MRNRLAYLGLIAAFVAGLWVVSHQAAEIRRLAHRADTTATELRAQAAERRALRNQQLAELHEESVRACLGRHRIVLALAGIIERGIAQTKTADFPDLTPAQAEAYKRLRQGSLAAQQKSLAAALAADCRGVPPLPRAS